MKKVVFACAYCEKYIDGNNSIAIIFPTGQQFWAHEECQKNKMRKETIAEIRSYKK